MLSSQYYQAKADLAKKSMEYYEKGNTQIDKERARYFAIKMDEYQSVADWFKSVGL